MKKQLKLPDFKNEDQEREYWAKFDPGKYFEAKDFKEVHFPNLKPTTKQISIRFPLHWIYAIKEKANKIGIPYQALIKKFVSSGLQLSNS